MVRIPFLDLRQQHEDIKKEINSAIRRTIKRGDFILGEEVRLFEEEFADFSNVRYAVGVASGTDALFLGLNSLGIGKNDEVIVPAFTFIATALSVTYTGAKPVFVDIDENTYNIDTKKIGRAVTKRTKAIIPVHLYGRPADMPEILKISKKYNLKVIEDAAQAHGASIKMSEAKGDWKKVGSIGDIGCFSFYPTKNLGGLGDGGIVITDNEEIYKKLLTLRDCGRDLQSRYKHAIIGFNSRLDTLQAAILRVKLKKLNAWNTSRKGVARYYNELFKNVKEVIRPYASTLINHVYHLYTIRTKSRDKLYAQLRNEGIGTFIHYPIPLHLQKAYTSLGYCKGDFPVAEKIALEIISLPIYPYLKKEHIKYIAEVVKNACKE